MLQLKHVTKALFSLLLSLLLLSLLLLSCTGAGSKGNAGKKQRLSADTTNSVADTDGNRYTIVKIGDQQWLKENLKVTRYRNGDLIPFVRGSATWARNMDSSGKCCAYNNDSLLGVAYGLIYNWYAVNDPRNICPRGWHIPSDSDWRVLSMALGGPNNSGAILKEKGPDRFSVLPAGGRTGEGRYYNLGHYAYFWNSSLPENEENCIYEGGCANECTVSFEASNLLQSATDKRRGMSVRCIKDGH